MWIQGLHELQNISRDFYHACREKRASFEELQRFLLNPTVRQAFSNCFESDHRIALSAFALAFFEIEPTLTGIAGDFLEALMRPEAASAAATSIPAPAPGRTTPPPQAHLNLVWAQFRLLFQAWKEEDGAAMSATLSQMYWEYEINYRIYENQLTPDEQEYYLEEKQRRQDECLAMLQRIEGGMTYFQTFTPVFIDTETSGLLIQVLRRAFWDRLIGDLKATPPQLEGLLVLMREIRSHLETLVGTSRPEWLRDYDEYFDLDFLTQRAAHPASLMTMDFWMPRCEKLAEVLIALDSAARQPHHEATLQAFKAAAAASAAASASEPAAPTLIPYMEFLEYFMTRLLEIVQLHQTVFLR